MNDGGEGGRERVFLLIKGPKRLHLYVARVRAYVHMELHVIGGIGGRLFVLKNTIFKRLSGLCCTASCSRVAVRARYMRKCVLCA